MAAGSQGWRENWADLPMAAIRDENKIIFVHLGAFFLRNFIFENFHPLDFMRITDMRSIIPISPIRLYIMACNAAFFAFLRENHHPIKRKDRNPTPSHPMKNINRFFADVNISIFRRKMIRSRENLLKKGSLLM